MPHPGAVSPRIRTAPALATLLLLLPACAPAPPDAPDTSALEARIQELEERFTPGLHTLMGAMATRHAMLWFAGQAENWALVDYQIHEMEELIEEIEELHPVYDGIPVAQLLGEMTHPAIEALEAAMAARDRAAFTSSFDRLTQACNSCHVAADREVLLIIRPSSPPITNLSLQR
jgi:hypothetical protein